MHYIDMCVFFICYMFQNLMKDPFSFSYFLNLVFDIIFSAFLNVSFYFSFFMLVVF